MINKNKFILLTIIFFSNIFAAIINLNNQTAVHFDVLPDNSLSMQIDLGSISLENISQNNQNFISVSIENQYFTNEPGKPRLPQINQLIEIPYGASPQIEMVNISEEIYNLDNLGLDGLILPSQPSLSKSAIPNETEFIIDNQLYSQNNFINDETVIIEDKGFLRAVRFGNLMINPISYNPISKELKVKTSIEFKVIFEDANYILTNQEKERLYSPYFEPIYHSMINYNPLNTREDMIEDRVRYIIIANEIFEGSLDSFVNWKTQKGFIVDLVYTNEIGSSASNISSYISNQYNNASPAPSFVLIVGDTPQVPASYSSGGHVSDLDYCDMTNDNVPDILHGRFSAQTPIQLMTQINKTIEYERYEMSDPSFLENVIMISGVDASYAPTYGNGQINYGNSYYFNSSNNINSHTYLYPESASSGSQILNLANQGAAFMNYTAHGWESGWADPEFDINDANAMTNSGKYPTMIGNCCLTSAFDSGVCFAEALLRKSNGGAIGYIGGSDVTYWNEDYWWGVGSGSITANPSYNATGEGAYDGMFHENGEQNWAIVNAAIMFVGNLAVAEANGMDDYYWEIYHLMGDPSLSTYFGVPTDNNVTHDIFAPIGTEAIEIQAEPLSYVGISQNGELRGSGTVDQSGFAVIVFNNSISEPGTLDIVVTAQNKQPYFGEIMVASPDGAYVTVSNVQVSYGPDNTISAGETIELILTLENLGNETSGNISVSLDEDDSYITIVEGYDSIDNLQEGEIGLASLSFNVASNAPYAHQFSVDLNMESDESDWSSTLNFALEALTESFEDEPVFSWESSDDADWYLTSDYANSGSLSMSSGQIGDNSQSSVEVSVDVIQGGDISFAYRVSSEYSPSGNNFYDGLTFYIDGQEMGQYQPTSSGESPWTTVSYQVSEGNHTFKWTYSKDGGGGSTDCTNTGCDDAAFIDDIVFPSVESQGNSIVGDVNGDQEVNVLDVIQTVNMALGNQDPDYINADINSDGIINVLDVILIANILLDGRFSDATHAHINIANGVFSILSDGLVAGVQMTIFHDSDFTFSLTDKSLVSNYSTDNNLTTVIVVFPDEPDIMLFEGQFEIKEIMVVNSSSEIQVSIPSSIELSSAYPNPFNPITNIDFYVSQEEHISVKVYDLMGKLVKTLANNEKFKKGTHTLSWDASYLPSGLYFIRAESDFNVSTQKVTLLK